MCESDEALPKMGAARSVRRLAPPGRKPGQEAICKRVTHRTAGAARTICEGFAFPAR